jgi:hypothetical protein
VSRWQADVEGRVSSALESRQLNRDVAAPLAASAVPARRATKWRSDRAGSPGTDTAFECRNQPAWRNILPRRGLESDAHLLKEGRPSDSRYDDLDVPERAHADGREPADVVGPRPGGEC